MPRDRLRQMDPSSLHGELVRRLALCLALCLVGASLVIGCGSPSGTTCSSSSDCEAGACVDGVCTVVDPDTGVGSGDAAVDGGPSISGEPSTRQTAAAGLASSSRYRLEGSVGAPQPFGTASSPRYRLDRVFIGSE